MNKLSLGSRPHLKTQVTPQLWGRVKLSNFMDLPEDEFRHLIKEIETHPLFKRLTAPNNPKEKIIGYQRFAQTDLSSRFHQIKEDITPGHQTPDLTAILEKKKEIIPKIKKIGLENFKRFFLHQENNVNTKDVARVCGITPSAVKTIRELMDEFYILDLTHPTPASSPSPSASPGVKIASIEPDNGKSDKHPRFKIGYLSPRYARGRYLVNYKKLFQFKSQDKFSKDELKKIERFVKDIEMINTRQTILYRIIKKVVETQAGYFKTGKEKDLKPLTQQMLARYLKVHRSTINRAINHKHMETPWGEEKYLKFFMTNRKQFIKRRLFQISDDSTNKITDEEIVKIFEKKYHIKLARRTICAYRHEMESGEALSAPAKPV